MKNQNSVNIMRILRRQSAIQIIVCVLISTLVSSVKSASLSNTLERPKRVLIFPPTSPTRLSFIYGIGIPVFDLPFEAMTIGYVFKAQFFLPDNVSYLTSDDFPWPQAPSNFGRRRRAIDKAVELPEDDDMRTYVTNEHYESEAVELESGPLKEPAVDENEFEDDEDDKPELWPDQDHDDTPLSRWIVYKGIEQMAERHGLTGRPCMLRAICESAHTPFALENGILGELMNILMTPSSSNDPLTHHTDNEYLQAENVGKSGEPCDRVFKECQKSLLGMFSQMFDPTHLLENFLG